MSRTDMVESTPSVGYRVRAEFSRTRFKAAIVKANETKAIS
jgi:hypothetical protein